MAGFIQVGDIIHASKLAWDVWNFGWKEEYSCARQYAEFGKDIKNLAQNLDRIRSVVENAIHLLQTRGGSLSTPLSDVRSLNEIIGSYNVTLGECQRLLEKNKDYRQGESAIANVEWNILVQPTAQALRQKIMIHNSKVLFLLKPFEIDLLRRVHDDLALRIDSVHDDLRGLIARIDPDYQQTPNIQAHQETSSVEIPGYVEANFELASTIDRPELAANTWPPDKAVDALVVHFHQSTANFREGILLTERTPTAEQFLSLLKCVWIMRRTKASTHLQQLGPYSHWPSYVKQLDQTLSRECWRFTSSCPWQLVTPDISHLPDKAFIIWPEIPPYEDNEFGTFREAETIMDELLDLPLAGSRRRRLRLLLDQKNSRFHITVPRPMDLSDPSGKKFDFTLDKTRAIPLYANPASVSSSHIMVLHNPRFDAEFAFADMQSVMMFQQAFTGFKPYAFYSQGGVEVSFVKSGCSNMVEKAHLQLWIPKVIQGKRLVSPDQAGGPPTPSSQARPFSFINIAGIESSSPSRTNSVDSPSQSPSHFERRLSLSQASQPSPASSGTNSISSPSQSSASHSQFERMDSVSSATTSALSSRQSFISVNTTSSRNSETTLTALSTGKGTGVGYMHSKPLKPMLVLFTKSKDETGRLSFVTVQLDHLTSVNPERCDCRKSARSCNITAIERSKGSSFLLAERYEANHGTWDWDVIHLGSIRQQDSRHHDLKGLQRVSIKFSMPDDRAKFGGTICKCKINTVRDLKKCIREGHQGLFGEVKEFGRQQLQSWHDDHDNRPDLENRQAPDHGFGFPTG